MSRLLTDSAHAPVLVLQDIEEVCEEQGLTQKRCKWGATQDRIKLPHWVANMTKHVDPDKRESYACRLQVAQIDQYLRDPHFAMKCLNDPKFLDHMDDGKTEARYDSTGKQINTRDVRLRNALMRRRNVLMARCRQLDSEVGATLPVQHMQKLIRRIRVPKEKYPDYNFLGAIVGPRGTYQKRLEQETGCMIAVRGRGTKPRKDGRHSADMDLPMHVMISAVNRETLAKGIKRIKELFVPASEQSRIEQMRELAQWNGTLRAFPPCHRCGETGHQMANCPLNTAHIPVQKCSKCGNVGHLAQDCKAAAGAGAPGLDSDMQSFLSELGLDATGNSVGIGKMPAQSTGGMRGEMKQIGFVGGPQAPPPPSRGQAPMHRSGPSPSDNPGPTLSSTPIDLTKPSGGGPGGPARAPMRQYPPPPRSYPPNANMRVNGYPPGGRFGGPPRFPPGGHGYNSYPPMQQYPPPPRQMNGAPMNRGMMGGGFNQPPHNSYPPQFPSQYPPGLGGGQPQHQYPPRPQQQTAPQHTQNGAPGPQNDMQQAPGQVGAGSSNPYL